MRFRPYLLVLLLLASPVAVTAQETDTPPSQPEAAAPAQPDPAIQSQQPLLVEPEALPPVPKPVYEPPVWKRALTLFGKPKYSAWFNHFDYANPRAPKGGKLKLAHLMTFDSLNPYILKGVKAPGMITYFESLMTSSLDEAQTYYPLVAELYRLDKQQGWMEFQLNAKAKWHDGQPITPEDIVWSLETIKKEADPVYRLTYGPLEKAEITAKNRVKFHFAEGAGRETPLLAANLPILPKHYYKEIPFNQTTLTPPLTSGPYRVTTVDPGRSITFQRVPDYWGRDLAVRRGAGNFDTIRYDVYRDATVALEALKAGNYDLRQENIARNWAMAYDTRAVQEGRLIKREIPNEIPQGMQAFFFNLRRPGLDDRRVREAIGLTMDYEWTNKNLFYGAYKRNSSFFQYTPFAAEAVPMGKERELLKPFKKILRPQLFTESFHLPKTDASGQNRKNLLKAQALLEDAGYPLVDGQRIHPVTKKPLKVEFLMNQATMQRVIAPMRRGLERLGIESSVRLVDDAQYQRRVETRDFDIISNWINFGVSFPGLEQRNYWHSSQADVDGSNNIAGLKNPAVDAMIERIENAHTLEDLEPPAQALDRILLWEHVAIPHWHNNTFRVAYWDKFGMPKKAPAYGLPIDFWWMKEAEKRR